MKPKSGMTPDCPGLEGAGYKAWPQPLGQDRVSWGRQDPR
jgi:hypothetical protein